ncbi:MAG: hypothetical protein ACYS99_18720, partial [Planctomycetota bacterium]
VGPVSEGKYLKQMQEALEKNRTMWTPKRPTKPPEAKPEEDVDEPPVTSRRHPQGCPVGCEHCGPAIERALSWLARRQLKDGRWVKPTAETVTRDEKGRVVTRNIDHIDVALTSIAGMALMAEGSTPREGRFHRELSSAVAFVKRSVREDGIISNKHGNDSLYLSFSNFETPLGAMFLAEAHRAAPDAEIPELLALVARHLEKIQDPRSGAWGYGYDFREYTTYIRRGWRLTATTHFVMTALNHAREAGIPVDRAVLERGARFLLTCRGRDGAFVYRPELRKREGYPGATAGALFALSRSGVVDERVLAPIRARYRRHHREISAFGRFWWFFLLHTALAMHDRGEGGREEFDAHFRDLLLDRQGGAGNWIDPNETGGGTVYATSIAALALNLRLGRLPIASSPPEAPAVDIVEKPRYLTPPQPLSRVKVFERSGRYLVDMEVSVDGPADDEYLDQVRRSMLGANRILNDVTDGQMSMHRVEILSDRRKWDTADIRITRDFYEDETMPFRGAHGFTMVSKRTKIAGGRETEGRRIGDWVKLPYFHGGGERPIRWDDRRFVRVLAHELCHYLFGAQDEYGRGTGKAYCDCLVGDLTKTELCRDENHTDDRYPESCWSLAKGLYPRLSIPDETDPGPWLPPTPRVTVTR